MGLGAQPQLGSRNIFHNVKYPHLSSETVFTALKLTQNFYLHYNISVFLESCYFNRKELVPSPWRHTCRTARPSLPFDKIPMKAREQKSQFSNVLSELEKIWKCNLGWSKIPISILIYELETKFWIYGWFGKVTSLLKIRWRIHIGRNDHILNLA